MKTKTLLSLAVMLGALGLLRAEEWRMLTEKRDVRDVLYLDGVVWGASSGGLIGYDIEGGSYRYNTADEGLDGIGVVRLCACEEGVIWVALSNRGLQRFEPGRGFTHSINSLSRESKLSAINDIAIGPRGIYLATNIGIAVITYIEDVDRWVWRERYVTLGSWPQESDVYCLALDGDYIWAGGRFGIARGDLNTPLPLEWENWSRAQGLPSDTINDLTVVDGRILAQTVGGLAELNGNVWRTLNPTPGVRRLAVHSGELWGLHYNHVYKLSGNSWAMQYSSADWKSMLTWDDSDNLWFGLYRNSISVGGLAQLGEDSLTHYIPDGPASNTAKAFTFNTLGDLVIAGGAGPGEYGLSIQSEGDWLNFHAPMTPGLVFGYQPRAVAEDPVGGVWLGTFGGGLARLSPDLTLTFYNNHPGSDGRLKGIGDAASRYVIASALAFDQTGNLWVVNRQAYDGNLLVCIPRDFVINPHPDSTWVYFHRSLFRNYELFELIAIDGRGRKWITSADPSTGQSSQGVYVFDDRGTLRDPSDDVAWGPLSGLNSPQVLDISWDPAGYIWVGSIDGAYYINANVDNPGAQAFSQIFNLRGQAVNSIVADPTGNKWFATNDGILVMEDDLFTVRREITDQAPDMLPSKSVRKIAIDPNTGWAYFATGEGIAALRTPYKDFGDEITQVVVEPNPFDPNLGNLRFTGTSLAAMAEVRIFTPDGRLVRRLDHDQAAGDGWDGRTDSGKPAADGVYIVLTYSSGTQSGTGKVALIRR